MENSYIKKPVTSNELSSLAKLAGAEEKAFFVRNPHLVEPYRQRLILVALCQGAAFWYLGRGCGVKDFDVHFFYAQNPNKRRLSRSVKREYEYIASFPEIPIDFIRTVVPGAQPNLEPEAAIQTVREFLRSKPTRNAHHLSQKAVIGLYPNEVFAKQVWPIG